MEKIDRNPNDLAIDRLEQVTVKLNEIIEWINEHEKRGGHLHNIPPPQETIEKLH